MADASVLVAYFSWSNGNTKRIAEELASALGADVARIETVRPYTGTYDEVVSQGKREVNEGYRPELKPLGVDPAGYDAICVGTPTWWYTMAPATLSFLESIDWSGKTIVPFMTNGGWPGTVIKDMAAAAQGAAVLEPMEIRFDSQGGSHMQSKQADVDAWIARVKKAL